MNANVARKFPHLFLALTFHAAVSSAAEPVGDGARNRPEDVAQLQAMLRLTTNRVGRPYVSFGPDGEHGPGTRAGIAAFQSDHQIRENPVLPDGPTIRALRRALPTEHAGVRVWPGTRIVYFQEPAAEAAKTQAEVENYADFNPDFKRKIPEVLRRMYSSYGVVLWVAADGWRRGFDAQSKISRRASAAGPGESSHHYGSACDLGFRNFRFLDSSGTVRTDDDWLQLLNRQFRKETEKLWTDRDTIAFSLGLHGIAWEKVHLQLHVDEATNNPRSLVRLLNLTGPMRWEVDTKGMESHYLSDLGRKGGLFQVGTAREIWQAQAAVTKTLGDGPTLRRALKAAFEVAEQNWRKWEPVP